MKVVKGEMPPSTNFSRLKGVCSLDQLIKKATRVIKEGGIVIYRTDTVYGLGADPFNLEAIKRIYEIKGRGKKPMSILASSIDSIRRIAILGEDAIELASKFWPGALTIIVKKKPILPDVITCGLPNVGVRIPDDEVALKLIRLSGGLLIGTSANPSGQKAPLSAKEIVDQIKGKVDFVLDAGPCKIGRSSTVLSLVSEKPTILRRGPISIKEIADVLGIREKDIQVSMAE